MNLNTFTGFAICLVLGLAALAVTVHVLATDEGLANLRARVRRTRDRRNSKHTTTLEGNDHDDGH